MGCSLYPTGDLANRAITVPKSKDSVSFLGSLQESYLFFILLSHQSLTASYLDDANGIPLSQCTHSVDANWFNPYITLTETRNTE